MRLAEQSEVYRNLGLSASDPVEAILSEWRRRRGRRRMKRKKGGLRLAEDTQYKKQDEKPRVIPGRVNPELYRSGIALARLVVQQTKRRVPKAGERARAKAQSEKIAWKMMSKAERKKKRKQYLTSYGGMEV